MPIATYSSTLLGGGFTQAQLGDSLRQALVDSGWGAVFDDYVASNERNLVFRLIHDNTRTMGTVFVRIQIPLALSMSLTIGTGWNGTTKTMTNPSNAVSISAWSSASPLRFHVINAFPELSGVMLEQVGTFAPVMCLFPAERMAAWDLNVWPFSFLATSNAFTNWRPPGNGPYGTSDWPCSLGSGSMSATNRITNRRDIAGGMLLFCPSLEGAGARTSDEIGMGSVNGLARFNELVNDAVTPNQRHLILSAVAGGLTQRIA